MSLSIAQFTFGLGSGGQERVVVDLAKAFLSQGHRSLVCTTMARGPLESELIAHGIPVDCLNLKVSYDPRGILPGIRYIIKNKVDVTIIHGTIGTLIPRLSSVLAKVPAVIRVEHNVSHNKSYYHIITNKILSLFEDRIVCVSEKARQSLLEVEGASKTIVEVIRNGLSTERFGEAHGLIKRRGEVKRIGVVARFFEQKGHIYFIQAAEQIVKMRKDVEFCFVGDGYLRPDIEKKVVEYDLQKYCRFLGERNDVHKLLQTFDVFVLPSLWEGLPISLLEAQYCGVPCVVTSVGGNPEVVRNEHNGFVVPPRNPGALATAIMRILSDGALASQFAARGKESFQKGFSMKRMTDDYLKMIDDIFEMRKKLSGRNVRPSGPKNIL
jgi:glycosyltransferase involved in cell wall biosynthesis